MEDNLKEIFVTRPSMPAYEDYANEIKSIWECHQLTNSGSKYHHFTKLLVDFLDVKNVELVCNGHMALEIALQSMNLSGEVITSPFTFASTTLAIMRSGLKPVFCDINKNDFTIDTTKLEQLITKNTCAIVPIHVYGNICDIENIEKIAKKYHLKVIYDAAHAFGETYKGRGIANYGDASCFSFHATKVFNSVEGGAICFNSLEYKDKISKLINFGLDDEGIMCEVGTNAKMHEFSAAMGICNLKNIHENIRQRKSLIEIYQHYLDGLKGITLRKFNENSNYSYFSINVDESLWGESRDSLFDRLTQNGIHARKYFYPLTNSSTSLFSDLDRANTPVAKWVSEHVLVLPIYTDMQPSDVKRICDVVLFDIRKMRVNEYI